MWRTGDWNRFTSNTIGSFVGLTPSEYSSGSSRVQGAITKTGNTHVRRLLLGAAWHHRPRYHVGAVMRSRWDQASAAARPVANVAIARELAGLCWPLAVMDD
jgi:transposase